MKSRYIFLRVILCILFPILGNVQAWGNNNNYFAQVTAHAIGPTGAGTVYAESNGNDGTTGTTSTAVGYSGNSQGNVSFKFTATPSSDIYDFKGWSTSNNVNATTTYSDNPYTRNYQAASSRGQNSAKTYDIYAIFVEKPLYYFRGTATVTPSGAGTASVSPATVNARGEHWNSTSATTTTIAFSATANTGYEFSGWSTTADGSIVSTANPYTPTLTSTSTNSGSPTNTTYYARFAALPQFYFSATAVSAPAGAGTVSASVSEASKYGETSSSTSASTNATFTATPTSQYHFLGWSTAADGSIENTNTSYTRTITSTSTDSNSPTNTTLYARFQPYATSITATPATLKMGNSATRTVTYTLSPADAYNKVSVSSSNSGVFTATCDNAGTVTVSAVDIGTATLTINALNDNDGVMATTTVTVKVTAAAATPTFSFDNSTNKVTISCTTAGSTIYYTTDGSEPTTSSDVYSGPFVQSDATTIKAIAEHGDYLDSEIGTYELVKLEKPYMSFTVSAKIATATFESSDDGVTFYYNSYDVDTGETDPGVPTSSSSSWTTGNANPTFAENHLVKLITMKAATATTGYITSDVFTRRANATDMSDRNYVFFYDDGTNVNFMANNSGMIANTTTFNPSTVIWEGSMFANGSEEARTYFGGALYYEPFIRFQNNGRWLAIYPLGEDEQMVTNGWQDILTTTGSPGNNFYDAYYFYSRSVSGRGTLNNITAAFDDGSGYYNLFVTLGYNTAAGHKKWERYSRRGNAAYAMSDNANFAVAYPVEERGGGGYSLTTTCPDDGAGGYVSLKKGESTTFEASTTGTYNPVYYRVGNEVKYFYYYPNTSTRMTEEPTGTNDIRITYELVNGQGYCELVGNKVTLLYDPGVDRLVSVRITATPYFNDVAQTEAIQEEYCYFHILTNPPFPAPVINRVEGTNQYEITCTAANSEIEYRKDNDTEWTRYTGPITVVTPGTVIMARSYRGRGTDSYELSDPVTYTVGGASLLIPTVTIAENGVVTISANANNTVANLGSDYKGETWLYTLDGSDPDPSHVGDTNPTKIYDSSTGVTLSNGQSIRVIAVDDKNSPAKFGHSAVAVAHYKVNSGIDANNSGVITLNDYEDHEWSYYQASADLPAGYPDELHSPYPRNVKITYYGYGENTLSTSKVREPAANTFNTNTTQGDVKVGIGEPGHTFIYYKTLERDANGRYPYQLIPNPFYVRPDVRTYEGNKTVTFTLNDAGGDGWGSSYLQIDYSTPVSGNSTENIEFKESQGSKDVTKTIPTGVTFTLTWHAGGGQSDECSFTVSGYDNNSSTYSSGTGLQSGPLTAIKVHGTESVSTYTGFYKWRIKSMADGAIYNAGGTKLADNETDFSTNSIMLDAETTYYFDPSDNGTTNVHNAESMTIELEALWAPAGISTNGTFSNTAGADNYNYNSVERNFYVGQRGTGNNVFSISTPCTYSSFYPNGTTNGTTLATMNNRQSIGIGTAQGNSKLEYYIISGDGSTLNAQGHNLVVGRGVTASGNYVAQNLYGLGAASTSSFNMRIESGTYENLYFLGQGCNFTNDAVLNATMGSDYDRAKVKGGDATYNEKLRVTDDIGLGKTSTAGNSNNKGAEIFHCTVKSGNYDLGESKYAGSEQFYISVWGNDPRTYGKRTMIVEGGIFSDISGGMEEGTATQNVLMVDIRIKDGTMNSVVYGAAQRSGALGHRRIIITGGLFKGWIAGGANGNSNANNSTGEMSGNSYLYVGGNAEVNSNGSTTVLNRAVGGNVFGAGCGYGSNYSSGLVTGTTNVSIADNAYIERGVYGGGSYGYTTATANLYILGGKVDGKVGGVNGTTYSANINGGVFGGACQNQGGTVNITMTGGLVNGGIYGGSNATGNISNNVSMYINGGQVGTDADHIAYVHGGGLGNATRVLGSVNMTIGSTVGAARYATIFGDVYGGSAEGRTNGNNSRTANAVTNVTMNAGKIHGSLYGGGLGTGSYQAHVYGPIQVTVNGGGVHATSNMGSGAVYGCNNVNGAPQSTVKVDIYGTDAPADGRKYALDAVYGGGNQAGYTGSPEVTVHNCDNSIEYVYGGGNAADITGNTTVTIWGGNEIGTVFGGGHGDKYSNPQYEANVTGNVAVNIHGGTIGQVFGGSNSKGTIGGNISVDISRNQEAGKERCKMHIGEVYGGGNEADSNAGSIHIGCTGDMAAGEGIGDVYGGANKANVNGNITLDIEGGNINRVFGGNNTSGDITGTITVDIDWNSAYLCRSYYLGSVFGGGNLANYTAPTGSPNYPEVNIKNTKGGNTTVSGNVFGAGMGDEVDGTKGVVTGNPVVNIIGGNIGGDVYGGGSYASVEGSTSVNLVGGSIAHNVYGGGLGSELSAAMVKGNATVLLNGGTTGATNDCEVKGTIFGCNNVNGSPTGHVLVHVYKTVAKNDDGSLKAKPTKTTEVTDATPGTYEMAAVYGGGNLAAYEPADGETKPYTEVIIDGCDLTSIGYVYGGGNAASVPATNVTVNGTYEIGWLFGGGNGKDEIAPGVPNPGANVGYKADGTTEYGPGTSTVNINGGTVHKAFGGSNTLGNVRTSATVNLDEAGSCPLEIDEVYGGGNEAFMAGGGEIILGCITYMKEIYGGARNADVGSNVSLTITSGHFDRVFGGNNQGGKIKGSITVNIEETGCNPITIGELYGCGNAASYSVHDKDGGRAADPVINIKSFTSIGRVFGGGLGASATVTGNPTVNIDEIVGGNAGVYNGSTITYNAGTADEYKVTLPTHASGKIGAIGTVFGGGNAAPVIGNTNVNIGTQESVTYVSGDKSTNPVVGVDIREDVFGGGLGSTATVSGDTNVVVGK